MFSPIVADVRKSGNEIIVPSPMNVALILVMETVSISIGFCITNANVLVVWKCTFHSSRFSGRPIVFLGSDESSGQHVNTAQRFGSTIRCSQTVSLARGGFQRWNALPVFSACSRKVAGVCGMHQSSFPAPRFLWTGRKPRRKTCYSEVPFCSNSELFASNFRTLSSSWVHLIDSRRRAHNECNPNWPRPDSLECFLRTLETCVVGYVSLRRTLNQRQHSELMLLK